MDHRFDLLGSGWVRVEHGMPCRGIKGYRYKPELQFKTDEEVRRIERRINRSNIREAQRVWSLIDPLYHPIDWQLDFKSGYRWHEECWYRRVKQTHLPGVDIKVPWELARAQHLPQLALAKLGRLHEGEHLTREFRNQVLDFVATNPPRFGVNWTCTMDVGIRVANWVLAYILFEAAGAWFNSEFKQVFQRSVHEHGCHILNNLEWSARTRANHYLGDIAGLVFAAAFLPSNPETDAWLAFGIHELIAECEYQFLPDGGHFQGSTCYHRLAIELILFPTALILGLEPAHLERIRRLPVKRLAGRRLTSPGHGTTFRDGTFAPFPEWYFARLAKASDMLEALIKPFGRLAQIGDNDSGRLFKLAPQYRRISVANAKERFPHLDRYCELPDNADYWIEEHLDVLPTVQALNVLIGRQADDSSSVYADTAVVAALSKGRHWKEPAPSSSVAVHSETDATVVPVHISNLGFSLTPVRERVFRGENDDLTHGLTLTVFRDFGCYVYRSESLYLLARCWHRRPARTAHLHNDQLAVELVIDGNELITDPGSFVYTPLPEERNRYRSVHVHDTPWPSHAGEPAHLDRGLFVLTGAAPAQVLAAGGSYFCGMYQAGDVTVVRWIRIFADRVVISDWASGETTNSGPHGCLFSPGYGMQEERN